MLKQLRLTRSQFIGSFFCVAVIATCGYYNASQAAPTSATRTAKVVSGDTVYSILKRHGFNDNQRNAAVGSKLIPKDFVLSPGDTYRVSKGDAKGRTEIRFFSKKSPTAFVFWRQGENSGSDQLVIKYDKRVVNATGRIRGSLIESISKAVGDDLVAYRFMDAFLLDYNLPKVLQKNAPFSITYEKLYDQGQFVRYGEVLRAEIEIAGETVVRDFRQLKKGGIFLNSKNDHATRPFYAPVDYISISSLFQPRRFHPIKKYRRAHEGIDFELPEGAPVYSVSGGTVVRIGRNRAAGNFIVVRHANGYESYYNHLSFLARLNPGSQIDTGTQIGGIGCTGYCTKPHLHFAIKRHGRFVNPINLVRSYSYGQRHDVGRLLARFDR